MRAHRWECCSRVNGTAADFDERPRPRVSLPHASDTLAGATPLAKRDHAGAGGAPYRSPARRRTAAGAIARSLRAGTGDRLPVGPRIRLVR